MTAVSAEAQASSGVPLAFRDEGGGDGGPALVLLNGLFQSMPAWQPVLERLPPGFRRITLDLPNQGPGPARPDCRRFDQHCDAVADVLAARGLAPADTVVVGFSFGAEIARALAQDRGFAFRRLVLAAVSPPGLDRFWRLWFGALQELAQRGRVDDFVRAIAFHMFSPGFFQAQPKAFDVMMLRYREYFAAQPEKLALLAGAPLSRSFGDEQTDRPFVMPVELIVPSHDGLIPADLAAAYGRRIGATVHPVEAGHTVAVEAPEATAAIIARAVARAAADRRSPHATAFLSPTPTAGV